MINKFKWEILLIIGCCFWGIGSVVNVFALKSFSPFYYCSLRFLIGSVILSAFFRKEILVIDKHTAKVSLTAAVFLAGAFILEVFALRFISPVKVEFLIYLETIIIPVIYLIAFKKSLTKSIIASVFIAFAGLVLINHNGVAFSFNYGDFLAFLAAVFYSMQVIIIGEYAKKYSSGLITILQLLFGAAICFIAAFSFEKFNFNISNESLIAVIISGVFCTGIAYYIETFVQKNISTVRAGIIYSSIPIFSIAASKIALNIVLTPIAYAGCAVIVLAIVNAETNAIERLFKKIKK